LNGSSVGEISKIGDGSIIHYESPHIIIDGSSNIIGYDVAVGDISLIDNFTCGIIYNGSVIHNRIVIIVYGSIIHYNSIAAIHNCSIDCNDSTIHNSDSTIVNDNTADINH
jgi:hypothetical protein